MSVKIDTSKIVTVQKAYWVTHSNNTSLKPHKLINIDFRSAQLKRKCIETALISSTNHLHGKKPSPEKKWLRNQAKLSWTYFTHLKCNLKKNLLYLEPFLVLLTSSNQMPLNMKTNSWQNYILRNLSIHPLKTFLSNVTTFMKPLQSHKKRHWTLSHKQEIRQKAAKWYELLDEWISWMNNCICHKLLLQKLRVHLCHWYKNFVTDVNLEI